MSHRLTVTVTDAQASTLPHPSCRPLVLGLLAVLDDRALGADPSTTRHAWVGLDHRGRLPLGAELTVRAAVTGTARLGAGDGVWIDVDVVGPDGSDLLRSRHVVTAALAHRPDERGSLPRVPRPGGAARSAGRFVVSAAALAAYRTAADDTSEAHADAGGGAIVPGLLALWSALRTADLDPAQVEARFAAPLPVVDEATVVVDGATLAVAAGDQTVVRARTR